MLINIKIKVRKILTVILLVHSNTVLFLVAIQIYFFPDVIYPDEKHFTHLRRRKRADF